jgi:hypothetical protein
MLICWLNADDLRRFSWGSRLEFVFIELQPDPWLDLWVWRFAEKSEDLRENLSNAPSESGTWEIELSLSMPESQCVGTLISKFFVLWQGNPILEFL